jgi:hypothetical protein
VTKELEDGECSVSAEERDEDDDDTRSTKKSKLSAVYGDNPAFDGAMQKYVTATTLVRFTSCASP